MRSIRRIEKAIKDDPDRVRLLTKKGTEEIVAIIMSPNSYRLLCRAAGAPPCDSIWHVTAPREPSCSRCGVSDDG